MYQQIFKLIILPLVLACFGLSPAARAVTPAPDGGYAGDNTAEGTNALFSLTSGSNNTANGSHALFSNTTGADNTANGSHALFSNTTGFDNTANGVTALYSNTTGYYNTANGGQALYHNSTGNYNTANGYQALRFNTYGGSNTANGFAALYSNRGGAANTANGYEALYSNTYGGLNTANGFAALYSNINGAYNTANGYEALFKNTTGGLNTANGFQALYSNINGYYNTAIGYQALDGNTYGTYNTAIGYEAGYSNTTGGGNVYIGAGVYGNGNDINTTRIRNVYFSVASGRAVYVNSDNKIGTLVSSRRFKDEIKPMDKASEAILALKPVTFRYKKEIEPNGAIMFGLIAEEVEKVDPDLVTRNDKGEAEAVRYEAVNAMLLNEFLKEHKAVQEQGATIAELKKQIVTLIAAAKEQAAQIQKVSAQLEASKPARQVVLNNQ
jgi:hypothetical protein